MSQSNDIQDLHRLLEDADSTRAALAEVKFRKAQMVLQFDEMIATLESKLASMLADENPANKRKTDRML